MHRWLVFSVCDAPLLYLVRIQWEIKIGHTDLLIRTLHWETEQRWLIGHIIIIVRVLLTAVCRTWRVASERGNNWSLFITWEIAFGSVVIKIGSYDTICYFDMAATKLIRTFMALRILYTLPYLKTVVSFAYYSRGRVLFLPLVPNRIAFV